MPDSPAEPDSNSLGRIMDDSIDQGARFAPRRLMTIAAVSIAVLWVGWTALVEPELPDFRATGAAAELPPKGSFPAVSLDEFEGILVGLRGQPVVVNIWASWCAPCRTEMPLLQNAADNYAGEAVILGVASNDDPGAAKKFLDDLGLTYPNVFDGNAEIQVALGLTAYPTTYVFGADGTLVARVNGGISEQRLAGLIEDALG